MLGDLDEVDLGAVRNATVRLAVGAESEDLLHDVVEDEQSEPPAVETVVSRLQRQEQVLVLLDVLGHVATAGWRLLFRLLSHMGHPVLCRGLVVRGDHVL